MLAKTLLFAMLRRIRGSRQMEYELKHSIDWLAHIGAADRYATLSNFAAGTARAAGHLRQMVQLAINLKIANLAELCIDGTRVLANANRYKTWTSERLARALEQLDSQIVEALATLEANDSLDEDLLGEDISADRLPTAVANLQTRREQLAALMETTKAMDEVRKTYGSQGPAQLPKTDPDSRILPNKEGGYAANYTPMVTTETGCGMIVMADVVIGNVEHDQLGSIIDTVQSDFDVEVERALVDSAYTTGENLTLARKPEMWN
ncbi:MAG: hypothetical protein R3C99_16175 [Pirellulaceae bacterium]